MKTQVGIVGAGPAGLFLAHLLGRAGIAAVILEARSREDVEGTIRAGVLEQWVVDLLRELGLAGRLERLADFHRGISLQWNGQRFHLDMYDLTGGKQVTVYPQHEVLRDLIAGLLDRGGTLLFEAKVEALEDLTGPTPRLRFRHGGAEEILECDFIVGADGFHGPSRQAIPAALRRELHKTYPFGWLGILTEAPRSWHELIYANQAGGFALLSTRTPEIQRLYIQCDPHDDLANWPDERIWAELDSRLALEGWTLHKGPIFQKGIIPLRSFVCETMHYGRLFLAGDAAHIVPPTGAKGLNLAVADVKVLARALIAHYHEQDDSRLARYDATCLKRIWKGERFSWYMTTMLHRNAAETEFERRIHLADLDYVRSSRAAATALAENYVGLPFEDDA
jgi:p-hydroxybenzoate 3-monooxygenase